MPQFERADALPVSDAPMSVAPMRWARVASSSTPALARSFPDLAAARWELPAVLARYDTRPQIRVAAAPDLPRLPPLPIEAIAWGSVGFGVVVAALSTFGLAMEWFSGRIRPAAPLPVEGRGYDRRRPGSASMPSEDDRQFRAK